MTLPACKKCNNGFSFHEEVVRSVLTLVSSHEELVAEREPEGRLTRSLARNRKLRELLERSRDKDGNYVLNNEIQLSLTRVFQKTVQGLFYGLYGRLVAPNELQLTQVENSRFVTAQYIAEQLRPSPLEDITDKPLSAISPSSWHFREPIFEMMLAPIGGGLPEKRIFRLKRDTPIEWVEFQKDIFRFAFVKLEGTGAACVIELWRTLIAVLTTPWPDKRGPLRKGKKNPMSRDRP